MHTTKNFSETCWLSPPFFHWQRAQLDNKYTQLSFFESHSINQVKNFLKDNTILISLPRGKKVQVKRVSCDEPQQISIEVKGLSFKESRYEMVLSSFDYPWVRSSSFILLLKKQIIPLEKKEVFLIAYNNFLKVKVRLVHWEKTQPTLVKAYLDSSYYLCLGSFVHLEYESQRTEALILSGVISEFSSKKVTQRTLIQASSSLKDFFKFRSLFGSIKCPKEALSFLPDNLIETDNQQFISKRELDSLTKKLLPLLKSFGGVYEDTLDLHFKKEFDVLSFLLKKWLKEEKVSYEQGYYWLSEGVDNRLSPIARFVLKKVQNFLEGCSLLDFKDPSEKQVILTLLRLGLILGSNGENYYFSFESVELLTQRLRESCPSLNISLSEIRDKLKISRKASSALCEVLEKKGLLKRKYEIWNWATF